MSLDLSPEQMRQMAHDVTDLLVNHLSTVEQGPALRKIPPGEPPALPLADAPLHGRPHEALIRELQERVFPYHAREPHPGFMAYVPSCPTFPAMVGDWIATGYNFYAGVFAVANGPNRVELVVVDWFRRWLGMDENAFGLLTTGGSAANFTAIVAARHHATGGDAAQVPALAMYTSDQAHSSVARAGWMAGIARDQIRSVPTDSSRRMRLEELAEAVQRDRAAGLKPFAVVASAGTTNTGAVDPLPEIAAFCRREGLWLHVDAAYGGFAVLTESGKRALKGIELADSITLDPHKWLYVPFECGCLIVRDRTLLSDAYRILPEYLRDVEARGDDVNFADYGEQLTRYSRAMKVWFSVNYFGTEEIASAIQRTMDLASLAAAQAEASPDIELLSPAQMAIVCFRARPSDWTGTEAELDEMNQRVLEQVNESGKYFISSTRLDGKYSMRICILGFRTSEQQVTGLMQDVAAYAKAHVTSAK